MTAERWWEIVELPAEITLINLPDFTFEVADEVGVYVVNLHTNKIMDGPR